MEENKKLLQQYIHYKLHNNGLVPASFIRPISTDVDHFPYTRYFRGIATCPYPRVWDREAGYRKWQDQQYAFTIPPSKPIQLDTCFQIPCSTVLPCVNQDIAYKKPSTVCVNIPP